MANLEWLAKLTIEFGNLHTSQIKFMHVVYLIHTIMAIPIIMYTLFLKRKIILHARTDKHVNNVVAWFHETPDYLYGVQNGNYQYGASIQA